MNEAAGGEWKEEKEEREKCVGNNFFKVKDLQKSGFFFGQN